MKSFIVFFREQNEGERHVMAFMRANPLHRGHEEVINSVHDEAKKQGASHSVILSHSHDSDKNPLSPAQKVEHARQAFPGTNVSTSSKESPSILHHASKLYNQGVRHLTVVGGSDREPFEHLLHKYNGETGKHGHYDFHSIKFVRAGAERKETPSGSSETGTQSWSASRMRAAAKAGNKDEFMAGAPSKMKPEDKESMYHNVRSNLKM